MNIDVDDILELLRAEKEILVQSRGTLVGKEYIIDKLIQYYSELKNNSDEKNKK